MRRRKKGIALGKVVFLTILLSASVLLVTYLLHGSPVETKINNILPTLNTQNESPPQEEEEKEPEEEGPFHEAKEVEIAAKGGFVYDMDHQELLFYKPAQISTYSIMKILTSLYALQFVKPEEVVTIGEEIYYIGHNASVAYIPEGQDISVKDLLKGIFLPSGCDATNTLAVAAARNKTGENLSAQEAIDVFVKGINEYVKTIPMVPIKYDLSFEKENPIDRGKLHQTQVMTPDGFPMEGQYSSVNDILAIAYQVAQNPILEEIMAINKDELHFENGHYVELVSTNPFLFEESPYYNPHVKGMKTGSYPEGDSYNMITWYKDGKNNLLVGVFEEEIEEMRYQETQYLIDTFTMK